jgi:CRP-like cAMP-binding protein
MSPFADWAESDILAVRSLGRLAVTSPGAVVMRAGSAEAYLGLVVRGQFAIEVPYGAERRRIAMIGPGDVFGEMTFVDGGPQVADVISLDTGSVIRVERHELEEFARRNPRLGVAFVRALAALMSRRLRTLTAPVPASTAAPTAGSAA